MSGARRSGSGEEAFASLLDAARANAPWAFERLYGHLAPAVAGYLRLHGAVDAEDLTNEVMLGVFRGLERFRGGESDFRSWVFTIAHHRLIDERRRRAARPVTHGPLNGHREEAGGDVEQEALAALSEERIGAVLDALTDEQRDVVLLRVVADLSVEDVAKVLGKQQGAVKMLQRRGLAALRRIIAAETVTS